MDTELSPDKVRRTIADLLYLSPDELDEDANLLDEGLDSLGVVRLIEGWRAQGAQVSFIELSQNPTLRHWTALLTSRGNDG